MAKKKEKKEKKAGKRMSKKELAALLIDFFHAKSSETLSMKYIFSELRLTTHPQKMLCVDILHDLLADDYISEIEKGKFRLNSHGTEMTGTFQRKSNGKNSFIPEEGGDPIFVAERNSAHAMNNDKVKITFYAKRKNREAEGEVIEILERANDTFVGTLEVAKSYAFLVTENRTLANDIFIPKDKLKGGKTGDKAIVKVTEWPDKAKNPIGQVIDILGQAGDNTTEMHAILAERVEIVVRVRRLQRRADGRKARIADGRGRQALVHTQVVGRILIEVRLRERAGIVLAVRVAETVDDRRVDLELMVGLADVVEAVVNHGGDVRAVLAIRLLFNERGNNEDLLKRIAGLLHLRHQLIVHALREVVE